MLLQGEDDANITYTDSAKTKFTLTAPRIESYGSKDPYLLFPKVIHIDFYNDSSKVNGHLDAGYAIRHENTRLMEADNNIIVVNQKGEQLNTEQLFWDPKKDSVYTHKFVKIRTATEIIYGDGLISNDEFTHYRITDIRGTITINKNAD
jgi:LPS export ABC transporter protein LptC